MEHPKRPTGLIRLALILVGIVLTFYLIQNLTGFLDGAKKEISHLTYSEFMTQAENGGIKKVTIEGRNVTALNQAGTPVTTILPILWMPEFPDQLRKLGIDVSGAPDKEQSWLMQIFIAWFPMILLIGIWIWFMKRQQGGGAGGGAFKFGKSKARKLDHTLNQKTFADVAGCEEAKQEVSELVDFLRDPSKFQKLGGRIPRGVLMVGNPGTGKTLLARAIAGEAKVPFFSISGSDFVEMFVGVGAARVRDMFEQAKKHAPCIIFIDEIDAVGRSRGVGIGGGNDEREQTLNQLLVEMDGFEGVNGVIVVAATNRPDVLDPALLRPGRFDRQVTVPLPDIRGREQILHVHLRKVPFAPDVKPEVLARGTPGMSGADLANLVNEAALFAARGNKRLVDMDDFERAKDKIFMGAERRSVIMPERERRNTAYHESGHAVVAQLLPKTDPVHKVSIIPRGRALGVTMQLPVEDRFSMDMEEILSTIAVLCGGRIAEEVFMGQMTTGASNDFERATNLARNMVTKWSMSKLGIMVHSEQEGAYGGIKNVSEATMQKVDIEVNRIIDEQYKLAKKLIEDNRDLIEAMTQALLEWETIDSDQVGDIMERKPVRAPALLPTPVLSVTSAIDLVPNTSPALVEETVEK